MEDTVAGRRTPHVLSGAARIVVVENFLFLLFSLPAHRTPNQTRCPARATNKQKPAEVGMRDDPGPKDCVLRNRAESPGHTPPKIHDGHPADEGEPHDDE